MEVEYIALSQSMRHLIHIHKILKEIITIEFAVPKPISHVTHSKSVGNTNEIDQKYNIPRSTVFEDNDACLKCACMPRLTPCSKHIGIPYHWFCDKLKLSKFSKKRITYSPISGSKEKIGQMVSNIVSQKESCNIQSKR
jgi:hypothetical protein